MDNALCRHHFLLGHVRGLLNNRWCALVSISDYLGFLDRILLEIDS